MTVHAETAPLADEEMFCGDRCQHHWVVEGPNGPTSWGECKRCGARREFVNNPDAVVRTAEEAKASR